MIPARLRIKLVHRWQTFNSCRLIVGRLPRVCICINEEVFTLCCCKLLVSNLDMTVFSAWGLALGLIRRLAVLGMTRLRRVLIVIVIDGILRVVVLSMKLLRWVFLAFVSSSVVLCYTVRCRLLCKLG